MSGSDLVLVLRYRKAVTYGFHVLLGALGQHETATRYEVRFGGSVEETTRASTIASYYLSEILWRGSAPGQTTATGHLRGGESYSMSGLEVRIQVRG